MSDTNKPENPPAFPCKVSNQNPDGSYQTGHYEWQQAGMTLRDYFAAEALQGILAANAPIYGTETSMPNVYEIRCNEAMKYANQMLKVRENGK